MRKKDGFPGQISFVLPEKIISMISQNPLISDLYLTDIGYYPHAKHHFRKRPAGSAQFILIYCLDGKGEIRIGDAIHSLTPDHFFIIPAGMPHTYHSDEQQPWSIYWIHFSGLKAVLFVHYSCQSTKIERNKNSRIYDRLGLFSDIFRNLERGYSIETLEFANLCLAYLLASFTHQKQFKEVRFADENDPISQSINFMLENLGKNLNLEILSKTVGLSVSHYTRLFRTRTSHTPIDYFIQLKIQKACRLLDNYSWSISEVAREMGFEDQFYFSRVFHKVMGMSPIYFRKRRA